MNMSLYRDIFTWPPQDVFTKDFQGHPKDIGLDLEDGDVMDVLREMIQEAKREKRDESFCLFDMGSVVERYRLWNRMFPTIRPFFAIKAYDDPMVVKLLSHLGAGFDCASKNEIQLAQAVGVRSEDIIFANPTKLPSHLDLASRTGVHLMTFDTCEELLKVKQHCPNARLVLRLCPAGKYKVEISFSDAFGCSLSAVPNILQTAQDLNLHVVGVSFHVGSGCTNPEIYVEQIKLARKVFKIAAEYDIHMEVLNIGGGFSGIKGTEDILLKMSEVISACISENFHVSSGVTVMAEPGRFFVESGLTLATSIIGKHNREKETKTETEYVLSESMFGVINRQWVPAYRGLYRYHPSLARDNKEKNCHSDDTKLRSYVFRGPTAAASDKIVCTDLPDIDLKVGDWLVFEDVGAYTVTLCSGFNGFPKPPIRRVMTNEMWNSLMYKD